MLKKHLNIAILSLTILCLFSCKNFMNGSDLISNLDQQVWNSSHPQPVVRIISPEYSLSGDHKNAPIIISFTKRMNPETFMNSFSVTDVSGTSMLSHYLAPSWNDDFTMITFLANKNDPMPVQNGNTMSIKISISNAAKDAEGTSIKNAVSETFILNSTCDIEGPTLKNIKMAINTEKLNSADSLLLEDAIEEGSTPVTEKTQNIISKNHIRNQIGVYAEGYDYDSSKIWACFDYKRIYTRDGISVNETTDTQIFELTNYSPATFNHSDTFTFPLTDSKYADGIYKIKVYLKDISGNISNDSKIFYVVRDTKYDLTQIEAINTATPAWQYQNFRENIPITYKRIIENNKSLQLYNYKDDIYMQYRGTTYSTSYKDLKYYLNYGKFIDKDGSGRLSLDESDFHQYPTPFILENPRRENDYLFSAGDIVYPQEILDYIENNKHYYFYLEVVTEDAVGNRSTRTSVFPNEQIYYNYSYSNENHKITLNFDNKQDMELNNTFNMPGYSVKAFTRVYYGKTEAGTPNNELVLTRNFKIQDFDDASDLPSFTIDDNGTYCAVIQTCLMFHKDSKWCGTNYGVPIFIENISKANAGNISNFDFGTSTITASKESMGKGTGLTKITVSSTNLPTLDADSSYFYGWCPNPGTSDETWTYFSSNSTIINTLLNAPTESWAANDQPWNYSNIQDQNTLTSTKPADYDVTGKVQVFVKKGNAVKAGPDCDLTFSSNSDDNIPPKIVADKHCFMLYMSPDGSYFYPEEKIVADEEWNDSTEFTYYYTKYQNSWGEDLHVISDAEITSLPSSTNKLFQNCFNDNWTVEGKTFFTHSNAMYFPTKGLSDGDYMFFFTVKDTAGNISTGTAGKAHIGTFKNKLNVQYIPNSTQDKLKAELKLEDSENFEENRIFVQFYDKDSSNWKSFLRNHNDGISGTNNPDQSTSKVPRDLNFFAVNLMSKTNNKLTFETHNSANKTVAGSNPYNASWEYDNFPNALPKSHFYKFTATSFDLNPYYKANPGKFNQCNDWGNYAFPEYEEDLNPIDTYLNETVSIPSYLYIPASNEDLSDVTHAIYSYNGEVLSNKNVLINVISSLNDLGDNIDEWERRGKVVFTGEYAPGTNNKINFNYSDAQTKMFDAKEKGYYVITYHFVDNTAAISQTFRTY